MNEIIYLTFYDKREKSYNDEFVICQKNIAMLPVELVTAWKVIEYHDKKEGYKLDFHRGVYIGATDTWGNEIKVTGQSGTSLAAIHGQLFRIFDNKGEMNLEFVDNSATPGQIEIRSDLNIASVEAFLKKNNRKLAVIFPLNPMQKVGFTIDQTIWIGKLEGIEEESVMNSAIMQYINTSFDLTGLVSADIVVSDGEREDFPVFTLENKVYPKE